MASTRDWFETVAEAQRRAKRQLPRGVYLALVAGAEAGETMNENITAFSRLKVRPHVADLPTNRDLATTVMGLDISFPVICSPTGVQAVHPDGEVAVARAAQGAGTDVTYDMDVKLGGMLRFASGMIQGRLDSGIKDAMRRLKEELEDGGGGDPATP